MLRKKKVIVKGKEEVTDRINVRKIIIREKFI